ncbi:cytochrome P450 [Roseateles sp. BYS180W]|uniref:Cytochrome P450 n=1 Tax=Roseateles rivi TaxID=3299028 RepID=A0ABW7FX23_9BURK
MSTLASDGLPPDSRPPFHAARLQNGWMGWRTFLDMHRDYLGAAQQRLSLGDLVYCRVLHESTWDVHHPALVRELMVGHAAHLVRWERGIEVFRQAHGNSVIVSEGEVWQQRRRLMQAGFAPRRVEGLCGAINHACERAVQTLEPGGVDFEQWVTRLTMEIILDALFSGDYEGTPEAASAAVHHISVQGMRDFFWPFAPPQWLPWRRRQRQALGQLDGLVRSALQLRQQYTGTEKGDLLDWLMALRDEQDQSLSLEALRDECMTSFLAGHETTASALTWWAWCMAANPEAQAQVHRELCEVLGAAAPSAATLPRLPWLSASLKEAMRLYPPVPVLFARRLKADIELGGHTLRRGALLRVTPWLLHRDPRWWQAPQAFLPQRFMPGMGHSEPPRGAYLPFGAGPRSCLGQHFAMLEMTLVAAALLLRFELRPLPAEPTPQPALNVTLRPQASLKLLLHPRA